MPPRRLSGRVNRWIMVDALAGAAKAANEEVESYRRERGLRDQQPLVVA
jgi:hypothetical protein